MERPNPLLPGAGQDWHTFAIGEAEMQPICRELLAWTRLHGPDGVVLKSSVQAPNFPPSLLPHLALLESLAGGEFRFRLFGTARQDEYGANLTGTLLRDAETGEANAFTHQLYRAVMQDRQPLLTRTAYKRYGLIGYDRVLVPVADETGQIRWILSTTQRVSAPTAGSVLELSRPRT